MPPFERSIAATMLTAKESVVAPMRPKLREFNITEPQWRVMLVLNDRGATDLCSRIAALTPRYEGE